MKNLFLIIAAPLLILSSCGTGKIISVVAPPNQLSQLEQNDGWQLLFDGTNLNNWHGYGQADAPAWWIVQDSTIFFDTKAKPKGAKGMDLVSNEEYENFHLKYDWKLSPNGNSGLIFYIHEDPARYGGTYVSGPEMQIVDNDGHPDGKIIKHQAGDLYDLITAKKTVRPVGDWNTAEIISNKGKLEFYLNGEKTLETTMWDDNWKKMIEGSKFKGWEGFGTFTKGKIALQDHGNDVWFRNIKIKKL